ncbi:probable protein phosphatase 2C T23F11.1 isoform X2 [Symsagittifera roscoffensis]
MEDAHTCMMSIKEDPGSQFFGVFDGHGGTKIAQYSCKHLPHRVCSRLEYKTGQVESAAKKAFLDLDKEMMTNAELANDFSGSTACCVLIRQNKLYCMNVGDSRAIASIKGLPLSLSYDHKPNNIGEQTRIVKAGGFVELNRVNGNLALSRALGDFSFKRNLKKQQDEQIVSALPDVTVHDINTDLEFVVVACDGIWDVLSNVEVVEFCRQRIANQMEPTKVCEELISRCLATECNQGGLGCDNMTVILICFTHAGDSYAHLAKRCSRPSNLLGGGGGNSSSSQNQARGGHPVANGASFNTSPLGITSLGSSSRTNPHLQPAGASSKLYLNGSRSSWKY